MASDDVTVEQVMNRKAAVCPVCHRLLPRVRDGGQCVCESHADHIPNPIAIGEVTEGAEDHHPLRHTTSWDDKALQQACYQLSCFWYGRDFKGAERWLRQLLRNQ